MLNVFDERTPKVEVASYNKKLINKKAYKTYDKVLGDKFKLDFLNNKIIVKQNSLKAEILKKSKSRDDSFSFKTKISVSVENENFEIPNNNEKKFLNNLNSENNKIKNNKDINKNKNKNTYLTALDALDSFNYLDNSDSEGIGNMLSKNIQRKLEKFSKQIQTENSQSNTSIEYPKDKNKSTHFIDNSRESSNNSKSRVRANSNNVFNTINNGGRSPGSGKKKYEKSFLDNYIRLPKIVMAKIINNTSVGNINSGNKSNGKRNYLQNELDSSSRQLLKGFNKTKKIRYNLDSLVSKISYKVGNGFPLKKYVTNFDSFSNVYPKKTFGK